MNTITENRVATSFAYMLPGIKTVNYTEHDLIDDVSKFFKISVENMKKKSRLRQNVMARQTAMYFMIKYFSHYPLKYIGSIFGKDHATVIHAKKVVQDLNYSDRDFCYRLKQLDEIIDSHILKNMVP